MKSIEGRQGGASRLSGWQAIANYFQRNPSTVRRWATEHGLPIHRPAGTVARKGAAVFAYPEELDDWLRRFTVPDESNGERAVPPMTEPGGTSSAILAAPSGLRRPRSWATIGAAGFCVALAATLSWSLGEGGTRQGTERPRILTQASTEANRELYSDASYLVEKRTPQSLVQGVALLEQLTRSDPLHSLGWLELATAYNLMVEYGQIDASTGYERSRLAAETALALDPSLARAETVLADMEFFWHRAFAAGLARFERALQLDPTDAQTLHWYANALAFAGEPSRALIEIRKAKYADPSSRSIRVSEAIVLLSAGQRDAAGQVLESLIRHEPEFRNPYRFLAFVRLGGQDYEGYLDAWARRFLLVGDLAGGRIIEAGRAGLASGGQQGMREAMAMALTEGGAQLEPYFLAHVFALSGDVERAIDALGRVETRHAFYQAIDPAFSEISHHIEFADGLRAMKLPSS